ARGGARIPGAESRTRVVVSRTAVERDGNHVRIGGSRDAEYGNSEHNEHDGHSTHGFPPPQSVIGGSSQEPSWFPRVGSSRPAVQLDMKRCRTDRGSVDT